MISSNSCFVVLMCFTFVSYISYSVGVILFKRIIRRIVAKVSL